MVLPNSHTLADCTLEHCELLESTALQSLLAYRPHVCDADCRVLCLHATLKETTSSTVTERPRDGLCLVSFNIIQYLEHSLLLLQLHIYQLTIKFCSVVFGVTLRFLVINASSSVSRKQQTTPLISDECHHLATVPRSCVYNTWRSHC